MNAQVREKKKSDLIIEKCMDLYGFKPDEKTEENEKWMRKHGYK